MSCEMQISFSLAFYSNQNQIAACKNNSYFCFSIYLQVTAHWTFPRAVLLVLLEGDVLLKWFIKNKYSVWVRYHAGH